MIWISVKHEYIRKEYYNEIKSVFIECMNKYENNINLGRLFGVFLGTLYFTDLIESKIDDVLIYINDINIKNSINTIKQYFNYDKVSKELTEQDLLNIRNDLTIKWNQTTDKYYELLKQEITHNHIDIKIESDKVVLMCDDKSFDVNKNLYHKLVGLIETRHKNLEQQIILNLIWILIFRYDYFGMYNNNGQLALDKSWKKKLRRKYNCDTELFASPFNCYYKNYYSLFTDLEKYFGSKGRFNHVKKLEDKYYFSNPPFEEEIMYQASLKYIDFMNKYNSKFITTIPVWNKLETFEDYKALYILKDYIKKIKKYKMDEIPYFNYFTWIKVKASNTWFIILEKKI